MTPYHEQLIIANRAIGHQDTPDPDEDCLRRITAEAWEMRNTPHFTTWPEQVLPHVHGLLAKVPRHDLVHKCHAISTSFQDTYMSTAPMAHYMPLIVTVGNVYYQGKSLYPCTHESILEMIQAGPDARGPMNAHVWLTLSGGTVLDLTLLTSMVDRAGFDPSNERQPLLWRPDIESDFVYEPLLVDAEFMHRIDRIAATRT